MLHQVLLGLSLWSTLNLSLSIEASPSSSNVTIVAAKWDFHEFGVHITVMVFLLVMILIKIGFHRIPYVADYVPESLLLILMGTVFGAIVRFGIKSGTFEGAEWRLTPELFFLYLLPPIVLEASYSLYNRTFSEYLGVVLIFAVLGTILNFLIIGFSMYGLLMIGALGGEKDRFDLKGMLLFSSLIVAVDPVAVLAIFQDIGVELGLYYIVFGESLFNDAITVVLYDIMSAFAGTDDVTGSQIGVGIASFCTVSFGGLIIGVTVGVVSCLITRLKSHLNAFTLILLAYLSYITADCIGWSGIISMIGCGLVQAAYAFHNLDKKSVTLVHKLTKLVAEVSESVIFLFLGVEVLSENLEWHVGFMLWSLVLCLLSRTIVVLVITAIVNAVNVDNTKISLTKQLVLIYGGLRGAVAFSLAILVTPEHLGDHGVYARHVMITATLFIILFTVGFMGITIKPLVKLLKIRMQAKRQLSLFNVLNNSVIDEILSGIEIITNTKGRNVVRDFFMRLDEKYIRRMLQREPETYDHKIMRVYERIALRLHFASMQPNKMEVFLEGIPPALRNKYLSTFQSSISLAGLVPQFSWSEFPNSHRPRSSPSVERSNQLQVEGGSQSSYSMQSLKELTNEFVDNIRSTRKASIVSNEKRQVAFDETLEDLMRSRNRVIAEQLREDQHTASDWNELDRFNTSYVDDDAREPSSEAPQTSEWSTPEGVRGSTWMGIANEDSEDTDG